MKPIRLCLARHGETDWNAQGRIQGQLDIPLNARGLQQAQSLARALAGARFSAIYSSDLGRAIATATPVAQASGLPVTVRAEWRERHHGRMQGSTYEEIAGSWPEGHQRLRTRDPDFEVGGGESLIQMRDRCASNLAALVRGHPPGETLLVVTHGGVLDIVHRVITGQPLREPRGFAIRNCAYHWLQHGPDGWSIERWGEEDHLAEARDELPD